MSDLTGKELELAIAEEMGRERPPEEKVVDLVENHITQADVILQAVLDVVAMGRQEMEDGVYDGGDRFCVIQELLGQYRTGHENFIASLYQKKKAA